MKWAIIGTGFISPRHKQSIEEVGGEVVMTCDPKQEADFTDWKEMMESEEWGDVTHVAICTPNFLHFEMCTAMHDKIVLCEKPLTLSSGDALALPSNIFTVLQLRHHPEIIRLKQVAELGKTVNMSIRVKRDPSYWSGWKGDEKKSGGILFNLGIHYFDLLLYLFGEKYQVVESHYEPKLAKGIIDFNGTICNYHLEIMDTDQGQDRLLEINGEQVSLSRQDNLSFEGLHTEVYRDLLAGRGILGKEAAKSIRLVEKLRHGI